MRREEKEAHWGEYSTKYMMDLEEVAFMKGDSTC